MHLLKAYESPSSSDSSSHRVNPIVAVLQRIGVRCYYDVLAMAAVLTIGADNVDDFWLRVEASVAHSQADEQEPRGPQFAILRFTRLCIELSTLAQYVPKQAPATEVPHKSAQRQPTGTPAEQMKNRLKKRKRQPPSSDAVDAPGPPRGVCPDVLAYLRSLSAPGAGDGGAAVMSYWRRNINTNPYLMLGVRFILGLSAGNASSSEHSARAAPR